LGQITSTLPLRRMILHFSHIGLTEGRTFTLIHSQLSKTLFYWILGLALATVAVAATTPRSAGSGK
jgi:hypothetical protein